MEQTTDNIKKYLEQASKLESSVYEQKQSCDYARKTIVKPVYSLPKIPAPQLKQAEKPKQPEPSNPHKGLDYFFIAMGVIGIILLIVGIASMGDLIAIGGCLIGLNLCLFLIHRIVFVKTAEKNNLEADVNYRLAIKEYEDKTKVFNEEYEIAMAEYPEKQEKTQQAYKKEYSEKLENYNQAQATLCIMDKTYESTKNALEQVYAYDVIFPKYRNMTAMFTMLEYFQTGRCSELTGPNGAYNLYESELRQNIIINKLDTIIEKLDQIKENQFLLYTEMTEINAHLSTLSYNTKNLLDTSKRIEANSEITSYCSRITAQNTAALTVMTALK